MQENRYIIKRRVWDAGTAEATLWQDTHLALGGWFVEYRSHRSGERYTQEITIQQAKAFMGDK
jgi:hypothetical protein